MDTKRAVRTTLPAFQPKTDLEAGLAETLALHRWRLKRAAALEAQIFKRLRQIAARPEDETDDHERAMASLERISRCIARIDGQIRSTIRELTGLQRAREECEEREEKREKAAREAEEEEDEAEGKRRDRLLDFAERYLLNNSQGAAAPPAAAVTGP